MRKILSSSNPFFQKTLGLYDRYDKYLPLVSFFAGFSWDSLTLSRIDRFIDNLTILIYLILLAAFIIITNLVDRGIIRKPFVVRYKQWYSLAIQFFQGGLFSAYVVFYFQSASFTKTGLFLAILVVLLIANELLKNRLTNIYFQMALFFLAGFSFFIFFLPVITGIMNTWMFIAGGILSLGLTLGILYLLFRLSAVKSKEQLRRVAAVIASLYILLNVFYVMNWIPPIPLSMKFGGVFHQVQRVEDRYRLKFEKPRWYQIFKDSDEDFHYAPGDTVFCFASVFAPAQLKTKIYHHWQQYSKAREEWLTTDRISYPISGGRDGGYRGYTYKRFVDPGDWRIDVETGDHRLIGRIGFTIEKVEERNYSLKTVVY